MSDKKVVDINESVDMKERKRKRETKMEKYKCEREEIINELNEISKIGESESIILCELENNEKLKERLRELSPLIKKYYRCCSWGYFSNDKKKGMGNEITLLKSVYKSEGYKILSKRKMYGESERKLMTELYFIKSE